MYITGNQADFASRLHELGYDPNALPSFIQEGNQYIRKQTIQQSGKWEGEARRCQNSFTGVSGLFTQQFGLGTPVSILWTGYIPVLSGATFSSNMTPISGGPVSTFTFTGTISNTAVILSTPLIPGAHYQVTATVFQTLSAGVEFAVYDDAENLVNELIQFANTTGFATTTVDFVCGQPLSPPCRLIYDTTPGGTSAITATIISSYIMPP